MLIITRVTAVTRGMTLTHLSHSGSIRNGNNSRAHFYKT